MSQYVPPVLPDPAQPTFARDLIQALSTWAFNLKALLDHGLSFNDNVDCAFFEIVANSSAELSASHGLGRTPERYIIVGQSGAGSLFYGDTAWTNETIYLRSDANGVTFRVMVI